MLSNKPFTPLPGPSVFVSYAWENAELRSWVKSLATRLRADGINIILDVWETAPGDQLPVFMEKAIRESDFVLIICTPAYRARSNTRKGGVGYEGDILSAHVFAGASRRKFIPILRGENWSASAPDWLLGSHFIDLNDDGIESSGYAELVNTILNRRELPPPIGENLPGQIQHVTESNDSLSHSYYNLTRLARDGELQPIFVRKGVVRSMLRVLSQHKRRHVLLNGPSGVGKTPAIVSLALYLTDYNDPRELILIDVSAQPTRAFSRFLFGLSEEPRLIIALRDLHVILDQQDSLLSALHHVVENTNHQVVATTTLEGYSLKLKEMQLIQEHFTAVNISEPSQEETVEIVRFACERLKQHHGVSVTDEALTEAVQLAVDHVHEGTLPGKVLQLIDEACAYARFPSTDVINKSGLAGVVDEQVIKYVMARRLGTDPQSLS
jgi:hypothetical protein